MPARHPSQMVINPQQLGWHAFIAFIAERQRIWRVKSSGAQPPWTDDPVLAGGKFGNVFRRLDRGTVWELAQIDAHGGPHTPNTSLQQRQLELVLTYRHNLIPRTTETLMSGLGPVALVRDDRPLMSDVIKIWPLLPCDQQHATHETWAEYCYAHYQDVRRCALTLWRLLHGETDIQKDGHFAPKQPSAHWLHGWLQASMPRLGSFKAYEVLTSMTYLTWTCISENDFPHVGHGAMPALRSLTGDDETPDDQMWLYLPYMAEQLTRLMPTTSGWEWPPDMSHRFTCRSVEDALCEYRKYCAVKAGTRDNRPYPDNLRRWEQ